MVIWKPACFHIVGAVLYTIQMVPNLQYKAQGGSEPEGALGRFGDTSWRNSEASRLSNC